MFAIPTRAGDNEYRLLLIMEDSSVERVKSYDPAEFMFEKMGEPFKDMRCVGVAIAYVSPEEAAKIPDLTDETFPGFIKSLWRGFTFRPDLGDNDEPYNAINRNKIS